VIQFVEQFAGLSLLFNMIWQKLEGQF